MSKILKTDFIDHKTMRRYKKGEDVSHLSKEHIDFLTKGDHIDETESKLTANELIAKINEAETSEEVDSLIAEDESRKSVLKAAEDKKASFDVE